MRICISVGHGKSAGGGYDSGAVGGGFHEFRIARKIGFYIAEALKKYGSTYKAADALQMSQSQLMRKKKKYHL